MALASYTTTRESAQTPTRRALGAAFLATPAVLAVPALIIGPLDTMADWLDQEAEMDAGHWRLVRLAIAQAQAEGGDVIDAEDAVREVTNAIEDEHRDRLPLMEIGTPQTARRALAWADSDRAGDDDAALMREAVMDYLARLSNPA